METRSAQLELAHDIGAPRAARRFIAELLRAWGATSDAVDRSQLLVSELVSNAVVHGTGPVQLSVTEIGSRTGVYRCEVGNVSGGWPELRRATAHDVSGRGLQLVDELSHQWGAMSKNGETRVWFELHSALAS